MKVRNLFRAVLPLMLCALAPLCARAQQATSKQGPVDLGAFTKEIMALRFDGQQQQLVMWTPYEFFLAAGMSDGTPRESVERDLGFLKSFITVFIMSSSDRPDGTSVYATEAETRARTAIRLDDGTEVRPLAVTPPKVTAVVSAMKAFMAAQGGADRENMHVLVFPATTDKGRTIVDTTRKDKLTLTLKPSGKFAEATFTWRTPFDAMTNVPDCPRCKAGLSAKWSYCPYCGQKLSQ